MTRDFDTIVDQLDEVRVTVGVAVPTLNAAVKGLGEKVETLGDHVEKLSGSVAALNTGLTAERDATREDKTERLKTYLGFVATILATLGTVAIAKPFG